MVWQINLNNADLHSQFIISSLIYITHIRFKINLMCREQHGPVVRQQIIPRETRLKYTQSAKCEPLVFGNSLRFPEIMLEPLQKSISPTPIYSLFTAA
jgi:hypothetical protein